MIRDPPGRMSTLEARLRTARVVRRVSFVEPAMPYPNDPPYRVVQYEILLSAIRAECDDESDEELELGYAELRAEVEERQPSSSSTDHVGMATWNETPDPYASSEQIARIEEKRREMERYEILGEDLEERFEVWGDYSWLPYTESVQRRIHRAEDRGEPWVMHLSD